MERQTRVRVLVFAALATVVVETFVIFAPIIGSGGAGFDTHAYWAAWQHPHLYGIPVGYQDAYLYSPAFAQAFWPLSQLPWPTVGVAWAVMSTCVFAWLLAPTGRWSPLLLLACAQAVIAGNIEAVYGLVLVFGLRRPGLWALAALTKITPCVGPVWFLVRREWRNLAEAVAVTAVVAGVSFALAPHLWFEWSHFLFGSKDQVVVGSGRLPLPGLAFRLPIALALTVFAARRNKAWLLPVAMLLGFPALGQGSLAVLAAIPRLRARPHRIAGALATPTSAVNCDSERAFTGPL